MSKSSIEYDVVHHYMSRNSCIRFPTGYVDCVSGFRCESCEFAERLRHDRLKNVPLFGWRDALPQTETYGGQTWYRRPVLLSPEAMKKHGIEPLTINQVFICEDGPGMFKRNPAGEIDGYLLCNRLERFTVMRSECYGIPTLRAAEKYDEYFFLGLVKLLRKAGDAR